MYHRRKFLCWVLLLVLATLLGGCAGHPMPAPTTRPPTSSVAPAPTPGPTAAPGPLPGVTPPPRRMWRDGADAVVSGTVTLRVARSVDRPTRELLVSLLKRAGASEVLTVPLTGSAGDTALTVLAGAVADPPVAMALRAAGAVPPHPLPPQGYALAVRGNTIAVGGADADGSYYAAQTLRQLAGDGHIAGAAVVDQPSMPVRGVVEGFYGAPWTHAERMDQLAFYGSLKLNDYIYTPKDDPYARERWRDAYPDGQLVQLAALVRQARTHHVRFTYAVSPGLSICFSDPDDTAALERKLGALYSVGVRDFAIPFDDISYDRWNCAGDRHRYGPPGEAAAGKAQAQLLNTVWRDFAVSHHVSLLSVPTEYHDLGDSRYKQAIRGALDPHVELMWTGEAVVPPKITTAHAAIARQLWGRKVLLWDNYGADDYSRTEGRLLLAPYEGRAHGLSHQLTGDLLNPMNQAEVSKVMLYGLASYTWHTSGYNPRRAQRAAADHLSGGDQATTDALLAFFDTEHYAPTSLTSGQAAQPQAPVLAGKIAAFQKQWRAGDQTAAIKKLRGYAELLAAAPARIRAGVDDPAFLAECRPWLDALALWGKAFVATLDGLQASVDGEKTAARKHFAAASALADRAATVHTVSGTTKPQGPVRVADGVLDGFIAHAPSLLR